MKRILLTLCVLGFLFAATAAFAGEVPDLTGTWSGENRGIMVGNLGHIDPMPTPTFKVNATNMAITIEKQEGHRFYGKRFSSRKTESLVGFIDPDNKTLHMVDEDGYLSGMLNEDGTLFIRYLEAGKSQIATFGVYTKQ